MITFLLLIIAAILAALPIILVKTYDSSNNIIWLLLALLSYAFLIFVYIKLLKAYEISILYPLAKVISVIFIILIGIFFYGDKFNVKIFIGLFFSLIGLYLLSTN